MIASPVPGTCAAHPGVRADWPCQRCGSFVCRDCERRTRPDAPPLCPACWELRQQAVGTLQAKQSRNVQILGLVLGCISVLHPLLLVASLIINIRGLRSATVTDSRWMHKAGLAGSGVGVLVWAIAIAVLVSKG